MLRKILSCFIIVFSVVDVCAQNLLTNDCYGLKEGEFSMQRVGYFDPGDSGPNCLWNFSDLKISDSNVLITHTVDSLGQLVETDDRQINYFIAKKDTLFEVGNESPLEKIYYHKPLVGMKYPMAFEDSLSAPYEGYGRYCGDHLFRESGVSTVVVDGEGTVILSKTDTLKDVLRVYKLKSYTVAMDMDSAAVDTAKLKQVIEERYAWYARGYRYPIFETVSSTSYADLNPLGTTQYAYCFLPDKQDYLDDAVNKEIQDSDKKKDSSELPDIIHYNLSVNGSDVKINYNLDQNAHITMLISDNMGIVYRRSQYNKSAGSGYNAEFDLNGFRAGTYVLYINVNGKIYNEKIRI